MTQCPECSAQITIVDENCPSCNFPVSKLRGLCAATLTQDVEMVAALIQMGADVNSVDQNRRTPLMIASFIGDSQIVEMLLAAGANPEFTNDANESALTLAQTKDVERLLRRAIVVLKFSARKKETEEAIPAEPQKVEEPAVEEITPNVEEVPADIEEALTHLEPVAEPPRMNLDSTQPIPDSSQNKSKIESILTVQDLDSTQQIVRTLDSTQPIPIVFKELEIIPEEDESFTELEPDLEEDPLASEIDQFIQIELQDVQPAIVVESSNKYNSPTLDPIEESLTDIPDVEKLSDELDEFMQTELHDVQPSIYTEPEREQYSLTLDPMEFLMEAPSNTNETKEDISLQDELFDIQPSLRVESKTEEPSLTLDPMEELLMAPPVVSQEVKEDDLLQAELHPTENFYQASQSELYLDSIDPTEQLLEESEHREIEVPQQEPVTPEPVVEEPAPVMNQSPPVQNEQHQWEDWTQIEQAVAFAPWKIDPGPLDYEAKDEIELAQPIDEVIAPPPKTPEVHPQIFMNSTRIRNIAIGVGIAIVLIQFFLFMNWQLSPRKTTQQTKIIQAPVKETKPPAPAPKPAAVKPQPKVEAKKETVVPAKPEPKVEIQKKSIAPAPPKPEPKVVAAVTPSPAQAAKKQAKIKYEQEKSEAEPVPFKASPANDEKAAKARELNNRGSDLLRAGKVSEGISLLEQAVHTFPKNTNDENYASALLNLGRAWRMAGRPDISIRLLEQRMKINIERDEVARELMAAKRQALESGMGIRNE